MFCLTGGTATLFRCSQLVKTVTLTGASLSGADADNYNLASTTALANITKFDVTDHSRQTTKFMTATTVQL
jgi:hypothetical protein